MFQSSVPNSEGLKIKDDRPGPGTYKTVVSIEKRLESVRTSAEGNMMGHTQNSFLTKTKRGDFWRNEGETPYTKQTYLKNPGPGQYEHVPKADDLKQKILQDEAVHAAFSSSDVRDCNKKIKAPFPGPGTYIDINNPVHSSIKTAILPNNSEERS